VWREAAELNHLVMAALHAVGLPAVAFPPSAAVIARDGQVSTWELTPLQRALEAGLLPVVYGDVVFDEQRGGTILSTEDLFMHLARALRPRRLLLAGLEPGVWADYPACTRLVSEITPANYPSLQASLGASAATDVTGGMAGKVAQMMELVEELPRLEVLIFSAEQPGILGRVLGGGNSGTVLHA
jgi:isopentenyl phosphate kinase